MNGFRSDIDRLAARAGEFDELAAQARRIADDLRLAVDSAGECWGTDDVGIRFAATHEPASRDTLDRVRQVSTRLAGMGTDLADTARTYREVDESNASALGEFADPGGTQ